MLVEILFWFFAAVLVVSALGVIMVKNPVHAAMLLVLCFFTSANIWLLIEAEFLAVVLVLVYVGAVMVLFLFVVMMLDINIEAMRARVTRYAVAGGVIAGIVVFEIVSVVWTRSMGIDVTNGAQIEACRLQQYRRARQNALHGLRLSVRACGGAAAHRHCCGHLADYAQAPGTQVPGRGEAGRGTARGSRAHRQGASGKGGGTASRGDEAMIPLNWLLTLSGVLFAISVAGMFINRKSLILLLMCVELLLLAVNFNFVAFSRYLDDINGQIFVFFVLTVAAAESAIGLAILVVLFRVRRTINVEDMNILKG